MAMTQTSCRMQGVFWSWWTAPAGDRRALSQQKTGQCPSGQAAAAAGLNSYHTSADESSILSNATSDLSAFDLQWDKDRSLARTAPAIQEAS